MYIYGCHKVFFHCGLSMEGSAVEQLTMRSGIYLFMAYQK